SPVTVTTLPAPVTISFNYSTSASGTTTGDASIEGAGNTTVASNSKSLTPGTTKSDSIVVTIPTGTANGSYSAKVQVTNSTGGGVNNKTDTQIAAVNVAVCTPPSITTNPSNQTVVYGPNATFSAAASGNPTPSVQWQVSTDGGTTWSDISGASNTTLTVTAPTVSQSGNKYRAVFTNSCGGTSTATTTAATLTVTPAPVTVTFTAADKPYDGTTTATVSACAIASGKVGTDDVTCTVAGGTFASANASTSAQTVSATATLGGAKASNYTVSNPVTTTAKITPAAVTVTFTAADKPYDGTTTATVSACAIASGKVGTDDVTCTVAGGTF